MAALHGCAVACCVGAGATQELAAAREQARRWSGDVGAGEAREQRPAGTRRGTGRRRRRTRRKKMKEMGVAFVRVWLCAL